MPEQQSAEVIVISQLPPPVHGSTMMTRTFVETCEDAGLSICLVDRRFSTSVDEIGGTTIRKLLSAVSLFCRLWRSLGRRRSVPVVFFTTNRAPSFWMDVLLSALLRFNRRNYIAYVHTSGYSELAESGRWQDRGVRLMLGGATSVVVLGESMRADIRRFNAAVNVIPNTVADAEPLVPSSPGSPQLIFLSNLIPGKGAEDFMRIVGRCLADEASARAVVVGPSPKSGYTEDLSAMLDPGVRARVRFAGALYGDDRDRVLVASSVLVFPSSYRFEAQPLTLLESLRLAVPVVAYDTGGIKDIVEDGSNGYLVPTSDWRAASDRCLDIIRSEKLQRTLSAGARASFESRFSLDRYRRAWKSLLMERD